MEDVLREAVVRELGALAETRRLDRGSQASVWLVRPHEGRPVVVKHPHDAAGFTREVDAYARWDGALEDWIPRRLATLPPPVGALILEWVEGTPASDPRIDEDTLRALHREAGRFVSVLEKVGVEPDPMPLSEALTRRLDAWLQRARRFFDAARLSSVRARFEPEAFTGIARVAAHRDLTPDNWLCTPDSPPRLVVLDFGHARSDAPLTDLLKLWDRPWLEIPGAEAAFFEGYGRALTDDERERLRQLALLHGLATATWGREHDAPAFASLGDAILERLTGPSSPPSWR